MSTPSLMKLASRSTTFWEKCWDPKVCAHIPWNGDKCIGAHVCIRILEEGGAFFLEAEVEGHRARYGLANACIPTFTVGIARVDVCASNLVIDGGTLKSVDLSVKACVGASVGPINLDKCWELYKDTIRFAKLSLTDVERIHGVPMGDDRSSDLSFMASWDGRAAGKPCTC